MKSVLLLHPTLLFYKIPIWNKLSEALRSRGVRLIIWYTDIKSADEAVTFESLNIPMTMRNYRAILRKYEVQTVITLLFKKTPGPKFYFLSTLLAKWKKIKTVYYGHGFNLQNLSRREKITGNLILLLFNKIILYSPDQIKLLWGVNRGKNSVAYNTLDLEGRRTLATRSREEIRSKLGITEKTIILFSGRIEPRKRLDILIRMFENPATRPDETALVIVGPGMDAEMQPVVERLQHIYYLGVIYNQERMAEIFFSSDIFCIPGHLGLGVVEALYWGLPVVSLRGEHAPEVFYLQEGENSFLLGSENALIQKLLELSNDTNQIKRLSINAIRTFEEKASLGNMFKGFYQALGVED